jgi:hypothetical protein
MIRYINKEVVDCYGDTFFKEGEEVEIYKSTKSEKFNSGIGVLVINDEGKKDWICAGLLTTKIEEF